MKIKQMLTKIKPVFSFFDFYYNVIKRDKKRYEIASQFPNNFYIFITPLALMILQGIIATIIGSATLSVGLFLWIPIVVGNIFFHNMVDTKGREIRRRENEAIREKERQERHERMKRQHAEQMRREELRREEARKQRERHDKINQEKFERMYRDFFEDGGYSGQKTQRKAVDQNMVNAMKLMGLKEGFTKQDLKSAYRKLSKVHHPDAKTGSETNFKKLVTAYEYVLERI